MRARMSSTIAAIAAASIALVGCSSTAESHENGDRAEIEIGVFTGWPEGIAVSELWRVILEEQGYDVTLTTVDVAPGYSGVATGDYDMVMDTWMPGTHADYWDEYGDDLVDLGAWYDGAGNVMVVNEDAPITSLDELAEHADEFGNRIVGMEPGAGLTQMTEETVIPTYGLEDMEFITSSTAALLAEIDTATSNGENIVATLATPYWAFGAYPIRALEDPAGAYGGTEEIRITASEAFVDEAPQAAEWLSDFTMSEEDLIDLCDVLFNQHEGEDAEPLVAAWVDEHEEWVSTLTP